MNKILHKNNKKISQYIEPAVSICQSAGNIALQYFRKKDTQIDNKSTTNFDPVTKADRAIEQHIRQNLNAHFPEHGYLGEEYDNDTLDNKDYVWFIDPIDGTGAFASGLLHWGILLCLTYQKKPLLGLMYQPFTEEWFIGTNDYSEYHKQSETPSPLQSSSRTQIGKSILATTDLNLFSPSEIDCFTAVSQKVQFTRYGGDCYNYALLAMGFIDIVIESNLKPYDIQALIPIIKGSGGCITNWKGGDDISSGSIIAAANKELLTQAIEYLK